MRATTVINLSEENGIRYLHFGSEWIQGAMRIQRPFDLVLDYTREMMAWQECVTEPKHIVQLGLGAGSLTKYCWKHYPAANITAVELSGQVIACARNFFKLPVSDRLNIVQVDAKKWLKLPAQHECCDVLQVDLYDAQANGPVCDDVAFYSACRKALRPGGAMTVNVFGHGSGLDESFAHIFQAFGGACYALPSNNSAGNRVIVAQN